MPQADLERYLIHTRRKWRIIRAVMILLFAALAYIFHYLWENHTQIVYHEPMPPHYEA